MSQVGRRKPLIMQHANATILIVTPAGPGSKSGNWTTARRWQNILRALGATVHVASDYDGQAADLLVALHAFKSATAVQAFRAAHPGAPVVVALTGTDVNEYWHSHPVPTRGTLDAAAALVCLHPGVRDLLPASYHDKLHVIHQSAAPLAQPRRPSRARFDVCVIGHLREVKDPLRAAYAVRELPSESRIRVTHLGAAHDASWARLANDEAAANARYRWLGGRANWQVRRELARTRLMVLSSRAEGGANVIGEALVAGVPVLASRIGGNSGLLGEDYAGYFEVGATDELRARLLRAESDPQYLAGLERHCAGLAALFSPQLEQQRWRTLLRCL